VHRARLKELSDLATAATTAGDAAAARAHWQDAVGLVPRSSDQRQQISARIEGLREVAPVAAASPADTSRATPHLPTLLTYQGLVVVLTLLAYTVQ
jgi:hypothetical protein